MWKIPILALVSFASSEAFSPNGFRAFSSTNTILNAEAPATAENDVLKPNYEIEPIPMRIGHGFDIHRMAPIADAGQPIIIGGVEIPHKDQKVGTRTNEFYFADSTVPVRSNRTPAVLYILYSCTCNITCLIHSNKNPLKISLSVPK